MGPDVMEFPKVAAESALAIGDLFAPPLELDTKVTRSAKLERVEAALLNTPAQAEYELKHSFAPGVYLREILMLAPKEKAQPGQILGTLLIGHEHNFEHFNMVLTGRALVEMDGKIQEIVGPCYFRSGAGVRKVLWVVEDMRWVTIHANPDDEYDIAKLEDRLITRSQTFLDFQKNSAVTDRFKAECAERFRPRSEVIDIGKVVEISAQ